MKTWRMLILAVSMVALSTIGTNTAQAAQSNLWGAPWSDTAQHVQVTVPGTKIVVYDATTGVQVATATTNPYGGFSIPLDPGTYKVVGSYGSDWGFVETITVTAGNNAEISGHLKYVGQGPVPANGPNGR
jgi:Carboxypeptidase regulatory-like domain